MKYVKQFLIIMGVSFIGEGLYYLIPLPIPASIYGLVIMLALLLSKKLTLDAVKETADFLIKLMPIMFIPASVGLITYGEQLKSFGIPMFVISIVTTILVMVITGKLTDLCLKNKEGK